MRGPSADYCPTAVTLCAARVIDAADYSDASFTAMAGTTLRSSRFTQEPRKRPEMSSHRANRLGSNGLEPTGISFPLGAPRPICCNQPRKLRATNRSWDQAGSRKIGRLAPARAHRLHLRSTRARGWSSTGEWLGIETLRAWPEWRREVRPAGEQRSSIRQWRDNTMSTAHSCSKPCWAKSKLDGRWGKLQASQLHASGSIEREKRRWQKKRREGDELTL